MQVHCLQNMDKFNFGEERFLEKKNFFKHPKYFQYSKKIYVPLKL